MAVQSSSNEIMQEMVIPDDEKGKETLPPLNDEVEVEVIDDTPPADRGRGEPIKDADPDEKELASYSEGVRTRIQKLQRGYHDERRAKEAAVREAQEALRFAQSLKDANKSLVEKTNTASTQLHETYKSKTEGDLVNAKAEYKAAYESGDSDALTEAQEKLSRATMRHEMAISQKEAPLHVEKEGVKSDEAVYTAPEPDESAKEWAEANPWFRTDRLMTSLAFGKHEELIAKGIHPVRDAKKYYEAIDQEVRKRFPDYEWGDKIETPTRQKAPTVVASVTRTPKGGQKVSLTQTQVAIAKRLNVPLQEYAQQVAKLNGGQNG